MASFVSFDHRALETVPQRRAREAAERMEFSASIDAGFDAVRTSLTRSVNATRANAVLVASGSAIGIVVFLTLSSFGII